MILIDIEVTCCNVKSAVDFVLVAESGIVVGRDNGVRSVFAYDVALHDREIIHGSAAVKLTVQHLRSIEPEVGSADPDLLPVGIFQAPEGIAPCLVECFHRAVFPFQELPKAFLTVIAVAVWKNRLSDFAVMEARD